MVKTQVEVEDIDEKQENAEPRITVIEEFEVVLEWNNRTVSILNNNLSKYNIIQINVTFNAEINVFE